MVMKFLLPNVWTALRQGYLPILNEKKEELLRQGREVYNLSVGTPDFKPAPHVMEAFCKACQDRKIINILWWTCRSF